MTNFTDKLKNWLINKTSRTIDVPGGASTDQSGSGSGGSLINRNKVATVMSALKTPQTSQTSQASQTSQRPTSLLASALKAPQNPSVQQPTAEITSPMTAREGSALVQPNIPPLWRPQIGASLPMGPEERSKLIDAMIQKESSGVATAEYTPEGKRTSRGLMQLEKPTWDDISAWRKKNHQKVYQYDKNWSNSIVNRMYGTQYIYEIIPDMLTKKKIPVTFENVMASYTPGIGEFAKGDYDIKKYPNVLRDIARVQKFYE